MRRPSRRTLPRRRDPTLGTYQRRARRWCGTDLSSVKHDACACARFEAEAPHGSHVGLGGEGRPAAAVVVVLVLLLLLTVAVTVAVVTVVGSDITGGCQALWVISNTRRCDASAEKHDTHRREVSLALPSCFGVGIAFPVAARETNRPGWQCMLLLFISSSAVQATRTHTEMTLHARSSTQSLTHALM